MDYSKKIAKGLLEKLTETTLTFFVGLTSSVHSNSLIITFSHLEKESEFLHFTFFLSL